MRCARSGTEPRPYGEGRGTLPWQGCRLARDAPLSADQRALLRLAAAALRGMDAAGALLLKARLARRSAASPLSSACLVETVVICAARRWAELGRCSFGCAETVTLFLAAITVSLVQSP